MIDGLKPSQRQVLYCCFKRNLRQEIRVAQLAGYVSENGAYHHGEASLQGTIVNLAQTFVGTNNINLLEPIGQFGTRIQGGKDCAQPRYIHTMLSEITHKIFDKQDTPILKYCDDDGTPVEPVYYLPTIPILLVNGSMGVGTGWSTDIPSFNPVDIVANINRYLKGEAMKDMIPYYKGFKGTITVAVNAIGLVENNIFKSKGIYTIDDNKLVITELPIGIWGQTFKEHLDKLSQDKLNIRYYNSYNTDNTVHLEVYLGDKLVCLWYKSRKEFEQKMKLVSTINCTNMVAFNKDGNIKKYSSVLEILEEYIQVRLESYTVRKEHILKTLQKDIGLNKLKTRFITDFIDENIVIIRKRKAEIEEQLNSREYPLIDDSYDYLLKMPIYTLSLDKIDELNSKVDTLENQHSTLAGKTRETLWTEDINGLNLETLQQSVKKYTIKKKTTTSKK